MHGCQGMDPRPLLHAGPGNAPSASLAAPSAALPWSWLRCASELGKSATQHSAPASRPSASKLPLDAMRSCCGRAFAAASLLPAATAPRWDYMPVPDDGAPCCRCTAAGTCHARSQGRKHAAENNFSPSPLASTLVVRSMPLAWAVQHQPIFVRHAGTALLHASPPSGVSRVCNSRLLGRSAASADGGVAIDQESTASTAARAHAWAPRHRFFMVVNGEHLVLFRTSTPYF